jgi:hypothetical protein
MMATDMAAPKNQAPVTALGNVRATDQRGGRGDTAAGTEGGALASGTEVACGVIAAAAGERGTASTLAPSSTSVEEDDACGVALESGSGAGSTLGRDATPVPVWLLGEVVPIATSAGREWMSATSNGAHRPSANRAGLSDTTSHTTWRAGTESVRRTRNTSHARRTTTANCPEC